MRYPLGIFGADEWPIRYHLSSRPRPALAALIPPPYPPLLRRGAILRRRKYAGYYCKSNFCISAKGGSPTRGTASRSEFIMHRSMDQSGNRINLSPTSGGMLRGEISAGEMFKR